VLVRARTSDDTKEKRNVTSPSQKSKQNIKDKIIYFAHSLTNSHSANSSPFIYLLFIHLQVQLKYVKIAKCEDTMYMLKYSCQITQYNYNIMIM